MAISCSGPGKKCSVSLVLFWIAAGIVIWLVWFGTASLLGRDIVENSLQQLSQQLENAGRKYGKEVKLSHGKIDIEGWGYNKQAVVHDVVIEVTGDVIGHPMKFIFSTENMVISSGPGGPGQLIMLLSKPVNLSRNGVPVKSFVFSEPLLYSYAQMKTGGGQAFRHDIALPKKIVLLEPQPENIADGTKNSDGQVDNEEAVLNFDKSPTAQILYMPEQRARATTIDFSGFTLSKHGENIITIGSFNTRINEGSGDAEGRIAGKYKLEIADMVLYKDKDSTKPYALKIDTDYTVDTNKQKTSDANPDASSSFTPDPSLNNTGPDENRDVVVNEISLSNPDFKLIAAGKISNIKGDPLPSGDMNVEIDNLQQFMASEFVAMEGKTMIEAALVKITGQPLAEQTQVSIPMKREKSGIFYIGKTTFEELVSYLLSTSIMLNQGSGVERLPEITPALGKQPDLSPENPPVEGEDGVQLPVTAPNQQ